MSMDAAPVPGAAEARPDGRVTARPLPRIRPLLVRGARPGHSPDDPAVRRFWTAQRDIALEEVRAAVEGRSEEIRRVVLASDDASSLWAALEVEPAESTLVVETMREAKQALDRSKRTLGLVPAARVRPDMRALSVDGVSLFGGGRLDDLTAWPLVGGDVGESRAFDPARTWTLIAGGDVMLDREPHRKAVIEGRGADWLWDGGYARITSRTCCTKDGGPAISTRRVGPRGAVRELLAGADIAVVNHEAPAPNVHRYHPSGLVFNVDPDLLPVSYTHLRAHETF